MFQINGIEAKYAEPCGKSVWNNRTDHPTMFTRQFSNNEWNSLLSLFSSFFDIPNSKSVSNASQSSMYIHVVHVVHVHVVHITVRNSQRNIKSLIPRSHGTIFLRKCYLGQLCPVTLGYSDKNLKKYSQSWWCWWRSPAKTIYAHLAWQTLRLSAQLF